MKCVLYPLSSVQHSNYPHSCICYSVHPYLICVNADSKRYSIIPIHVCLPSHVNTVLQTLDWLFRAPGNVVFKNCIALMAKNLL